MTRAVWRWLSQAVLLVDRFCAVSCRFLAVAYFAAAFTSGCRGGVCRAVLSCLSVLLLVAVERVKFVV